MYDLFDLDGRGISIRGYHFSCEDPKAVVVLVHGIGEYCGRYQRVADHFKEAGIAMVGIDLRGHGRTEGERGHCAPRAEVLKDIDRLIEYAGELYPGVPIVLYGHSMGGNIGLDYRARGAKNDVPAKYLISAPWIRLVKPVKGVLYQTVKLMSKIAPKKTINSDCKEEDLGNLLFVRPYVEDSLVHPYISFLTAFEGFSIGNAIEEGENEDNGRAHDKPLLLMHGTDDKICDVNGSRNFEKVHKSVLEKEGNADKFEFVEWQGYYHEIHNGGPDGQDGEEVIKKMIDFILA